MLSFPTQKVGAGAVEVSATLDPADKVWLEGDDRPQAPGIGVKGRLSAAGPGRYYFNGALVGEVARECGRCLCEFNESLAAEVNVLFADDAHEKDDDPDVFPLAQGRSGAEIDLRPAVREGWLLEVPVIAVCRPDCKGLCPSCGANLNQGTCMCARKPEE